MDDIIRRFAHRDAAVPSRVCREDHASFFRFFGTWCEAVRPQSRICASNQPPSNRGDRCQSSVLRRLVAPPPLPHHPLPTTHPRVNTA